MQQPLFIMEWGYLVLAIILETLATTCIKMSDGFAKLLLKNSLSSF